MVWYSMVWYGMVWCGVVWYGMVWYGMVYIYSHGRVLCVKFGLLFPSESHSKALPIFLCALCIYLPIRVGFLQNFAWDNCLIALYLIC